MRTHRVQLLGMTLIAVIPWLLTKPNLLELVSDPVKSVAQVFGLLGVFVIMFIP